MEGVCAAEGGGSKAVALIAGYLATAGQQVLAAECRTQACAVASGTRLRRFRAYRCCPGEAISTATSNQKEISHALFPLASGGFLGLGGCATQEPPQMTTTTYNPATTTTTTYAAPAPGAPYAPIGSSTTTYAAPAPGYMAPSSTSTSTTYVTPAPGYMAPGSTTTVVRTQ